MSSNSASTSNKNRRAGHWSRLKKPYKFLIVIVSVPIALLVAFFLVLAIPFSVEGYHCRHNLPVAWGKIQIPAELTDNGSPETNFSPTIDQNCDITHTYTSSASSEQICSDLLKSIQRTDYKYIMPDCGDGSIDSIYDNPETGHDKGSYFVTVYLNIQSASITGHLNDITVSVEPS